MFEKWTEPSSIFSANYTYHFGQYVIHSYSDIKDQDLPIIGLLGTDISADKIRHELFSLAFPFGNCKVLDLGNLLPDKTDQLEAFLNDLIGKGIIPVILSADDTASSLQLDAGIASSPVSSWIIIHPNLAVGTGLWAKIQPLNQAGSVKVRFLGHQTHITPTDAMQRLHDMDIESLRLGHVRQNLDRVEPWCRSVDHAVFNVNALRRSDFPAKSDNNPGGFFYEEACKIAQFIGASSHLQSIGFYGYKAELDPDGLGAAVVAQLVWYTIDGLNNFREEKNIKKQKLTQYIVHASHNDLDINFWKSQESGRWWMEVPGHEHHWISCTYDDYLEASRGDFSTRLINVLNRM